MTNIANGIEKKTIDPIDIKIIIKQSKGVLCLYANE